MADSQIQKTYPEKIAEYLTAAVRGLAVVAEAEEPLGENLSPQVTPATDARFGHYQSNVAMVLAKRLRTNPRQLASDLVEAFDGEGLCENVDIAGPGFINFTLTTDVLASVAGAMLADAERLGVPAVDAADADTIVIDFSAPNVAKPMHVGHIRSTIIGDCLSRIARFLGHEVITDNHIGDWGTQFGMILYGWKNHLNEAALESDPVPELLRLYQEVNAAQKDDDELRETCKAELVKLQGGDEENLAIWKRCVEVSKQGLQKIYQRLDVEFDHWLGESFYNDQLGPLVEKMLADGTAEESDGAVGVFSDGSVPEKDDPFLQNKDGEWIAQPALIRKGDGGFLYATTDLATIDHRLAEFDANRIWYVVGAPQQLHFDQIFAAARRRLGDKADQVDFQFISFGSILGKDRKMLRTREGEVVQLADVLTEAVERAGAVVAEKNAELSAEEQATIAEAIGIGAVKYAELSQHRMTDYIFDWDNMLALKGNTAPYLMNAYVRTRSIFRKLGEDFSGVDKIELTEEAEKTLALKLTQFAETVPAVLYDFRPNMLAMYLFELANTFHSFYEKCPVLRSEGAVRETRLALTELTGRTLKKGLGLLGIATTERM
jgi:arginyl-tRNA synthetase